MRHEMERKSLTSDFRPGNALPSRPTRRNALLALASTMAAFLLSLSVVAADDDNKGAIWLRDFIGHQVGGIDKLRVPATDAEIPLPRQPDGTVNPRYKTTEEKRFLGKMLFHDPVRTARINPAYGGVVATSQTGSCGSCHLGEAAGKAGAVLNFNVGGEGRGYIDENGNYVIRRRPRSDLPILRQTPLFPGDALVMNCPRLRTSTTSRSRCLDTSSSHPGARREVTALRCPSTHRRLDALDSVEGANHQV